MASITQDHITGFFSTFPDFGSSATTRVPVNNLDRAEQERTESYVSKLYLRSKFQEAEDNLRRFINLSVNWDTYGAEPPRPGAVEGALNLLLHLEHRSFVPTRVVPSSEGGVAVFFMRGDHYADIEFLNTGEVLAVTYVGKAEPDVWEITGQPLEPAIERIQRHLTY